MTEYPVPPYKIKMVEPIQLISKKERIEAIERANYNLFNLKSEEIYLDCLTDSGTGAMSQAQWSAMMSADETYANATSYERFESAVKHFTGMEHVLPAHQGRAAENILFGHLLKDKPGSYVISNQSFDTTVGHILYNKSKPIDIVIEEGKDPLIDHPFKGNIDIDRLEELLIENGDRIPIITLVTTNNAGGGQPVSMENIKQTSQLAHTYEKHFFLDIARIVENAYFIQQRDPNYFNSDLGDIVREMCSHADGVWMSAKKDAYVNIGGFIALNNKRLAERLRERLILFEGFPTYGGMAGRDLEAIAVGLKEVVKGKTVEHRVKQVGYLVESLHKEGIPVVLPPGGHAAFIDAGKMLLHIPVEQFPGQVLACELYSKGGIRAVEIGSLMFGKYEKDKFIPATMELVRITIPRRVFTKAHMDYIVSVVTKINEEKDKLRGLQIVEEPELLRHFTCKLAPIHSELLEISE